MRTAIKQDLSQDLNLIDYVMWGVLENKKKKNANIGSLETAIKEEWNKMPEELILNHFEDVLIQ